MPIVRYRVTLEAAASAYNNEYNFRGRAGGLHRRGTAAAGYAGATATSAGAQSAPKATLTDKQKHNWIDLER